MYPKSRNEGIRIIAEFTDRAIPLKNNPKAKRTKPNASKKNAKPEKGPAKRGSPKSRRRKGGDSAE